MLFTFVFFLAAAAVEAAEGGIDQEIVLVGNDESLISLPALWEPPWPPFPPIFLIRPSFRVLPPISPPIGDWMGLLTEQFPRFLLEPPFYRPLNADALP
jgi:hypothetical protein